MHTLQPSLKNSHLGTLSRCFTESQTKLSCSWISSVSLNARCGCYFCCHRYSARLLARLNQISCRLLALTFTYLCLYLMYYITVYIYISNTAIWDDASNMSAAGSVSYDWLKSGDVGCFYIFQPCPYYKLQTSLCMWGVVPLHLLFSWGETTKALRWKDFFDLQTKFARVFLSTVSCDASKISNVYLITTHIHGASFAIAILQKEI